MSVKTSKETTDRQKAAVSLLSVLTVRGPAVAAALAERFDTDEEAFRSPILGFVGALKAALAELVAADEAHFAEQAGLATRRRRRDKATRHLTRLVVGLRRAVVALHVRPDLAGLGFAAETPREPVPLLRQVDRIVETFQNGAVGTLVGPALFDHARLDPQGYPQPLRKAADALREILDQVGLAQRRVEQALLRKRAARGEYDHLFLRSARIFENYCHLAGWPELAARVRPSRSRPGQTEPELNAEASGEVPDEGPDGVVAEKPLVIREDRGGIKGPSTQTKKVAADLKPAGSAGGGDRTAGALGKGILAGRRRPLYTHVLNRGPRSGRAPPSESGGDTPTSTAS